MKDISQTGEYTSGDIIKILPLLHDIEVIIWYNVKQLQHLVEHFTMLGSYANLNFKMLGNLLKSFYQRSHLYRFRTGAKNQHDSFHHRLSIHA